MPFANRREAGRRLADVLATRSLVDPVVLGLPRGGIPVAAEVAAHLGAPLDVLVVRKLGCPGQPELAMGAIGEGGVRVVDERMVRSLRLQPSEVDAVADAERVELDRRLRRYRRERKPVPLEDRTVVVVDDGLATGATARAAIDVVRRRGAGRVVLAVPVAPPEALDALHHVADDVVCLEAPPRFRAVGAWYADFTQTTDDEVVAALAAGGSTT